MLSLAPFEELSSPLVLLFLSPLPKKSEVSRLADFAGPETMVRAAWKRLYCDGGYGAGRTRVKQFGWPRLLSSKTRTLDGGKKSARGSKLRVDGEAHASHRSQIPAQRKNSLVSVTVAVAFDGGHQVFF